MGLHEYCCCCCSTRSAIVCSRAAPPFQPAAGARPVVWVASICAIDVVAVAGSSVTGTFTTLVRDPAVLLSVFPTPMPEEGDMPLYLPRRLWRKEKGLRDPPPPPEKPGKPNIEPPPLPVPPSGDIIEGKPPGGGAAAVAAAGCCVSAAEGRTV